MIRSPIANTLTLQKLDIESTFFVLKIGILRKKALFESDSVCLNVLRQFKKSSLWNENRIHSTKGAAFIKEVDLGAFKDVFKAKRPQIKDQRGRRVFWVISNISPSYTMKSRSSDWLRV